MLLKHIKKQDCAENDPQQQLIEKVELTDKPGSVVDSHSSGISVTTYL